MHESPTDQRDIGEQLVPANIWWRILQGVLDDLVVTAVALFLAWELGLLPRKQQFIDAQELSASIVALVQTYLPLTGRLGATLFLYATIKFVYYVFFVFYGGQTPACWLLSLRIVRCDGRPASLSTAVKRAVAGGVISHAPFIGHVLRFIDYLAALFNKRNQAVRDMVAETLLVHNQLSKR
jgi:uncharacterized RDD family membrane protein YckC